MTCRRVFSLCVVLWCGQQPTAVLAQSAASSAAVIAPACRTFLTGKSSGFDGGVCVGSIYTMLSVGEHLSADRRFCPPRDLTTGHAVHLVVDYIEKNPQRAQEEFSRLALEAMRTAWPCRGR